MKCAEYLDIFEAKAQEEAEVIAENKEIMPFKDFRQFSVWQKSVEMLKHIYSITTDFPKMEKYGLTNDIRRAANSVAHNIAEGYGRFENKDKTRFYKISRGSSYEVISQISVAIRLGYLSDTSNSVLDRYKEIISELDKLIKTVESR